VGDVVEAQGTLACRHVIWGRCIAMDGSSWLQSRLHLDDDVGRMDLKKNKGVSTGYIVSAKTDLPPRISAKTLPSSTIRPAPELYC
jgi:hypothetical protein